MQVDGKVYIKEIQYGRYKKKIFLMFVFVLVKFHQDSCHNIERDVSEDLRTTRENLSNNLKSNGVNIRIKQKKKHQSRETEKKYPKIKKDNNALECKTIFY